MLYLDKFAAGNRIHLFQQICINFNGTEALTHRALGHKLSS